MVKVTISFGPANKVTKEVAAGTPLSQILTREVKSILGCGDNVQALIQRNHVSSDYRVGTDVTIELETVSNTKAANVEVKVSFGPANSVTKAVPQGTTVGQLIRNRDILAALGVGSNVKALIDRVEQPEATQLVDGDEIVLETVSNSKAA